VNHYALAALAFAGLCVAGYLMRRLDGIGLYK
jgi:hypothetical protein